MKNAKILLVGVLTLTLILPYITSPAYSTSDATGITVEVRTSSGNSVLVGAVVKILNANGTSGNSVEGVTDSTGKATFSKLFRKNSTGLQITYRHSSIVVYSNTSFSEWNNTSGFASVRVDVDDLVIRVRDASGTRAVANAQVNTTFTGYTGLFNSTTTNSAGSTTLQKMPFGTYNVEVKYRGVVVYDSSFSFMGSQVTLNVSLYVLKVWVKDAQGNYVPNAVVKVWRNTAPDDNVAPFAETTTSSLGLAEFTLMPEGTYYVQIIYRDVVVYTASTGIVISGADREVTIETSLQTYTITVYDSDGSTVLRGEKYSLSGQLYISGSTPFGTPATTTDGELNFGLVFPGEYRLVIKLGNLVVFDGTITAPTDTSVNAEFYDLIINIDPTGVFDERLLSELGVSIQMGDIFSAEGVTTQRALRIENLPKGTYNYVLKYGTTEIGAGEFTLNEDEQRVVLKPDIWTLTLDIRNADGEAIKATVTISTVDGLKLKTLDTDDEGVLELAGLIPITYEITVFYENVKVGFKQIALNGDTTLEIITDVFNIRIRVLDADGEKAIPTAVVIASRDEISRDGITDDQGIALLRNLPIGKYRLEILYYDNPVHRQDEITFDASKQIDIKAKGIIDVTFNVLDAAGEPLDDGSVEIFSGQARFSENITKGQVRFSNIPAASYRLSVKYLGVEVLDQLVPLSIEEDVRNINTNVYYLSVEVKKADDTPLSSKVSFLYRGKEIKVEETNENGKLVVRLPKGEYSVQAYFKDVVVAAESIVLRSDAELLLNAAVYKVSIKFVDISEKPVAGVSINLVREGDIVESTFTNQDGVAEFYVAGGDYEWMFTVDNYTFTSNFAVEDNKEFIIPYVVNNVNNQVMVFASVAGVSAISVFSLFKFSKPMQRRERGERRQEERRRTTVKRSRVPRI